VLVATGEDQQALQSPAQDHGEKHGEEHGERAGQAAQREPDDLPQGEVVAGSGRISVARRVTPVLDALPFTRSQLARIDNALTDYSYSTGLHFSVYLGDLGADTRAHADELVDSLGDQSADAVLVAISPGQRVVEVVTGSRARHRVADRGCKVAVMSMVARFESGDLADGITSGLRILADQALADH
jgi:hypothetical protein